MPVYLYRPSLLDRLLDDQPDAPDAPPQDVSIDAIRAGIIRDLNDLVNTRRLVEHDLPAHLEELHDSMLTYGLARRALLGANNVDAEHIRLELQRSIERCEPRLKEVRVELRDKKQPEQALLRFHISAILYLPPTPQEIALAAELPVHPQLFSVSEDGQFVHSEPAK